MALRAGCDADCGHDYQQGVPLMIANGTIGMPLLDRAVTRVLTNRMLLGELEDDSDANPWRNLTLEKLLPTHRMLARRAAREAIVLLKNGAASAAAVDEDATGAAGGTAASRLLPVVASSLTKIAVVGPSADSPSAYIGD
jgi:beta-glucosidase